MVYGIMVTFFIDNSKTGQSRSLPNYLSKSGPKPVYEQKGDKICLYFFNYLTWYKDATFIFINKIINMEFHDDCIFQRFHMQWINEKGEICNKIYVVA